MTHFNAKMGQSVTEYGLIASLIALLSIGGLILLGNNISHSLSGILPSAETASSPEQTIALGGTEDPNSLTVGSDNSQQTNNSATTCVSEEWCLDFQSVREAEENTTQTTGSNGMELVNSYADVLEDIGHILDKMPEVDPTLREYIINSAVAGHDIVIADMETGNIKDESLSFIYRGADLRNYLQEHPEEVPAEVNQVIHKALDNIQKLSVKKMQQTEPDYYNHFQIPSNMRIAVDNNYDLSDFAEKIRKNANGLCKSGKADEACVQ